MQTSVIKGNTLEEIVPYMIVPLYNYLDYDPTHEINSEELPGWKHHWNQQHHRVVTPEILKFLQKYLRHRTSSSSFASWRILCILATLRVIDTHVRQQNNTDDRNRHEFGDSHLSSHWWSILISEHDDDNEGRETNESSNVIDDDDDDHSLLIELWPMIQNQEQIPFLIYQILYRRIQNRLHILTVPHPIKEWAQKTIFQLSDDDYETSWKIFQNIELRPRQVPTKRLLSTMIEAPNRLHASQLWLDRLSTIPERVVGMLIEDPFSANGRKEICRSKNLSGNNNDYIPSALNLPLFYQSCLPNTCLELYVADEDKLQQVSPLGTENKQTCVKILCRWLALYDISGVELEKKSMTLSTIPKSSNCECFRCLYEKDATIIPIVETLDQAQRLAHSYFQEEAYKNALKLYHQCYRIVSSITGCTPTNTDVVMTKDNTEWLLRTKADLFYTIGAVYLSQRKFSLAQQHWKNGSRYKNIHEELSKQLVKQRAYQYFHPKPGKLYETIKPSERQFTQNTISSITQPVFIASNVIDDATCRNLIQWALEYASNDGGWTNDRHYSVPTTDIPIHLVPKLLEWFKGWMTQVLFPTLRNQFVVTGCGDEQQRFYVHDAFLVRYDATASNHFLPLHYDESSHSCVCSLNDDFDGGGSYVDNLKRSIVPPTGGMVSFLGNQCLHGGSPVTKGVRFILAIFLYLDDDLSCTVRQEKRRKKMHESLSFSSNDKDKKKRPDVIGDEDKKNSKRFKKLGGTGEGFSFSFF